MTHTRKERLFPRSLIKEQEGRPVGSIREEMRATQGVGLVSTCVSQQEKINKQFASLLIFYFSNTGAEKDDCGTDSNSLFCKLNLDSV